MGYKLNLVYKVLEAMYIVLLYKIYFNFFKIQLKSKLLFHIWDIVIAVCKKLS